MTIDIDTEFDLPLLPEKAVPAFAYGFLSRKYYYMAGVLWALNMPKAGDRWIENNLTLEKLSEEITGGKSFKEAIVIISRAGEIPKDDEGRKIQARFYEALKANDSYQIALDRFILDKKTLIRFINQIKASNSEFRDAYTFGQEEARIWAYNNRWKMGGFEYKPDGYLNKLTLINENIYHEKVHEIFSTKFKLHQAKAFQKSMILDNAEFAMGVANALGFYYFGEINPPLFERFCNCNEDVIDTSNVSQAEIAQIEREVKRWFLMVAILNVTGINQHKLIAETYQKGSENE